MKLLITGDWHITNRAPRNRIDDYPETQFNKIQQLFRCAKAEGINYILQPGDVFYSPQASYALVRRYVEFFIGQLVYEGIAIITVFGQHDMRYHSTNTDNTPLAVMGAAETLFVVHNEVPYETPEMIVYGASWGEEIPTPRETNKLKVLLTHRMIISDEKLWDGQSEYSLAQILLAKYGYDLIVSGDNHETFTAQRGKKLLFNAGSLMRMTIAQHVHKPSFFIYDTNTGEFERREHTLDKFSAVMDVKKAREEKQRNENLDIFVKKLSGSATGVVKGLNFVKNLEDYLKENDVGEEVEDFIREVFEYEG